MRHDVSVPCATRMHGNMCRDHPSASAASHGAGRSRGLCTVHDVGGAEDSLGNVRSVGFDNLLERRLAGAEADPRAPLDQPLQLLPQFGFKHRPAEFGDGKAGIEGVTQRAQCGIVRRGPGGTSPARNSLPRRLCGTDRAACRRR